MLPPVYEVLNKDTIKSEIPPPLSVPKRGYASKKVSWRKPFQYIVYKLKAFFLRHIMRKK